MEIAQGLRKRATGIFYGWWIVAAGIGIQMITTGLFMHAYGAYVVVMQSEFGWSKTAFSAGFSLLRIESGLLGPVHGWLLDRFGPRLVMTLGLSLLGLGFALFSQVNSLSTFYLVLVLIAVGSSLGGFVSISSTVVQWFRRRRASAMGIVLVGLGLGGVLTPFVAWALSNYGWRATAFVSGAVIFAVCLPLAQVFRQKPEQFGLLPDGDTLAPAGAEAQVGRSTRPTPRVLSEDSADFSASQALRTWAFWLISLGHALGVVAVGTVMAHAIIHMNESLGYSLELAASVMAVMTATAIVGTLLGGFLGDRFEKRWLAAGGMLGSGAALIVLAWANGIVTVMGFAVLLGLAHGIRGVLMQPMRADYFGRTSFATIMGYSSMVVMWGVIFGPLYAGVMVDRYGDYRLAFTSLGLIVAAGSLCFLLARRPTLPANSHSVEV